MRSIFFVSLTDYRGGRRTFIATFDDPVVTVARGGGAKVLDIAAALRLGYRQRGEFEIT